MCFRNYSRISQVWKMAIETLPRLEWTMRIWWANSSYGIKNCLVEALTSVPIFLAPSFTKGVLWGVLGGRLRYPCCSWIKWFLDSLLHRHFFHSLYFLSPSRPRFSPQNPTQKWQKCSFCWGFTRDLPMVSFSFKLASSWLHTGTEIRAKQSLENRNNEEVGYQAHTGHD